MDIGFIVWFPILRPALATNAFINTSAATAFIGGSVFEIGSYLMVVEALDRCIHPHSAYTTTDEGIEDGKSTLGRH